MRVSVERDLYGLTVVGDIVSGDWEGDPSVPNGVHYLPPYVDGIEVYTGDGSEISEWLKDGALEDLEGRLIEEAGR